MALTKVTKSGITDNAIDADKLEDGTIVAADITPGTITADKLNSTLDLSSKTVTLPNSSVSNAMLAGSIANAKLANSSFTVNGTSVSLGGSTNAGTLDWQTVITADGSTGTTGVAGRGYFINTTSAAHTFTLPASATRGDTIAIVDYAGTFATYNLTIARNGHNIQGVANNSIISTNRASVTLVYIDSTKGWIYQDESNVSFLGPTFITATGGTVLTSGDYKTHVFTGDGSFIVSTIGNPFGSTTVEYLVVAGGGSGAGNAYTGAGAGGGGAGGYRQNYPSPDVAGFPVTATTYPITVGAGGTTNLGSVSSGLGTSGSNSVFSTITSTGGGRGSNQPGAGASGGSGGGGTWVAQAGGAGNTPPTSPPQGNTGGAGSGPAPNPGLGAGGGGGAGAVGGVGNPPSVSGGGGLGGIGSPISDTFFGPTAPSYGTPGPAPGRYFAGGGGGGTNQPDPYTGSTTTNGFGGAGGGGMGGMGRNSGGRTGTAGTDNTGGGGGGSSSGPSPITAGGNGGKGVVVIRYRYQ